MTDSHYMPGYDSDSGAKLDPPKSKWKSTTRGGKPVRIYAELDGGEYPIHGAIWLDNVWDAAQWTKNGCFSRVACGHVRDLIPNEPERPKKYVFTNVKWLRSDTHLCIPVSTLGVLWDRECRLTGTLTFEPDGYEK